jgi:hypothetical protein
LIKVIIKEFPHMNSRDELPREAVAFSGIDDLQLDLMERQVIGRPVMPHMRAVAGRPPWSLLENGFAI